jgi:hypothetical protein
LSGTRWLEKGGCVRGGSAMVVVVRDRGERRRMQAQAGVGSRRDEWYRIRDVVISADSRERREVGGDGSKEVV